MNARQLEAIARALEAQSDALRAQAATIRANLAPAPIEPLDEIPLERAIALLGSKRRAREFFARAERDGFEVRRAGHAVFMSREEWTRALDAFAPKRTPRPEANDDSPAALLEGAGLTTTRRRPRAA